MFSPGRPDHSLHVKLLINGNTRVRLVRLKINYQMHEAGMFERETQRGIARENYFSRVETWHVQKAKKRSISTSRESSFELIYCPSPNPISKFIFLARAAWKLKLDISLHLVEKN